MDKTSIVEIKKIAFTKLHKFEVYTFFNEVVDVISKYDFNAMHIGTTCDALIGLQPKSELLNLTDKDFGPHPLTKKVSELHEKRLKFGAIITNQMRTVEKASFAGKSHYVLLAKPVVLKHLNYLREVGQVSVTQLILQFFDELEEDLEVQNAFYELGLRPYLDEFKSIQFDYLKAYDKRRGHDSKSWKGNTLPIQRELLNVISILFNQVDYYQHVHKDIDYSVMISTLNFIIATYTKVIKTRDTQRKNKKLKLKNDEAAALEEKMKMDRIENIQPDTIGNTSVTSTPADETRKEKGKLPVSRKKKEGKDEPINGLLNILKKPDKGKNEDGD